MSIRLVRFESGHLPGFEAMLDDPEVVRFTPMPAPAPDDFGPAWLERYESGRADGTREAFAIVEDDQFLGIAVAPSINAMAGEAELGYMVAPWARRRGAATAALTQLTGWAFEDQGLLRVYLRINVGNDASRAVARRCGYAYEGTLRSTYFKGNLRVDTEVWSRLPGDP